MPRRFRHWLVNVAGLVLVLALMPLNSRLIKAHPSALWAEMGAMSVFMFMRAYQNELRRLQPACRML